MKLSIVIVSWNVRQDLVRCIRSIEENQPCEEFEVVVVDNASTDGTVEAARKDFPEVITIVNSENRGFATANNHGIERSKGEYILFLNPDTIVQPFSLDVLVDFLDDNRDVGACGPKLLNNNGTTQPSARRFPTFRGALHRHTVFRFLHIFKSEYKKWLMKDFKHDKQMDVDQVMGAALMVRRSVIDKVGGMDESFFMYYEEVDLCYRIKQAGWRIVFIPEAVIIHSGGRSTGQIPVTKRIVMLTSLLTFLRKHHGKFATGMFNCVFKPAIILRDVCNIVEGAVTYTFAGLVLNRIRRGRSAAKVKHSAILLSKYSWQVLFRL
ncbi:MAG: glycosyltransferase family 2 protein [Planctomycetota bacterium]|jgi:GT2 family glycosyltransferase